MTQHATRTEDSDEAGAFPPNVLHRTQEPASEAGDGGRGLTVAELADAMEITPGYAYTLARRGIIERLPDGTFDLEAARANHARSKAEWRERNRRPKGPRGPRETAAG
jgi:hypothetical protein